MKRIRILGMVMAIAILTAATAQAGPWNGVGRKLGLGWSDGYHSRSGYSAEYGWTILPAHAPGPMEPVEAVPPGRTAPAPAPEVAPRPLREAARPAGPILPSQQQTPRPVYWSR